MTDLLVELEEGLPLAISAIERKRYGQSLSDVLEKLKRFDQRIDSLVSISSSIQVLSNDMQGHEIEVIETTLEDIRKFAVQMEGVSEKEDLDYIKQHFSDIESKEITNITRSMLGVLKRHVEKKIRPLNSLSNLFEHLEEDELAVSLKKIAELGIQAQNAPVQKWPEVLSSLEKKMTDFKIEMRKVTQSEEIDQFLMAFSEGDVPLTKLTPNVLSWLKEQDALESFAVTSA